MSKSNGKKTILVITGTRAEYGLLKSTIDQIRASKKLALKLLATGMHTQKKYGYTLQDIKRDNVSVDCVVKVGENDSMLQALSKEISGIEKYCLRHKPDMILVLGDRDEAFAGAVVGTHLNIPIVHISGGDVSELTVDHYLRNAVTIFSSLHLTQTKKSYQNVIALGASPKNSHVVGSLGLDNLVLSKLLSKERLAQEFGLNCHDKWFLFVMHPTPFEKISFTEQINGSLRVLKQVKGEKIVIYPNSDTGGRYFIKRIRSLSKEKHFYITPNMSRTHYLSTLASADVLIGNTSSGLIEAEYLKIPFVHIGGRQQGRECGANVLFSTYRETDIMGTINKALSKQFKDKVKKSKSLYSGDSVAERIINIIEDFLYENK